MATLKLKHRRLDARPDRNDERDRLFVAPMALVPAEVTLDSFRARGTPLLDQGQEGSCTGFGLAAVANAQIAAKSLLPVSPRCLYTEAKVYDEYPGTDYEGSSCRGALKGWSKVGVCSEKAWPYSKQGTLTFARAADAKRRPLAAYARIAVSDLDSIHSAIAGNIAAYCSLDVHAGWDTVKSDGLVPYQPGAKIIGGHAVALVGYNAAGFWVQNSWGARWGHGGFCLLSYADWLANGYDCWTTRPGAPVNL